MKLEKNDKNPQNHQLSHNPIPKTNSEPIIKKKPLNGPEKELFVSNLQQETRNIKITRGVRYSYAKKMRVWK